MVHAANQEQARQPEQAYPMAQWLVVLPVVLLVVLAQARLLAVLGRVLPPAAPVAMSALLHAARPRC
jgi:hypothetical protein